MRGFFVKTLIIKDLTRKYQIGKDKVFVALRPSNLSFDSTGLVAIVGKSGSGKSTLINLLAKIDKPSEGEIYLNGRSYSSMKKRDDYTFYNSEAGIVFQQYNLLEDYTVLDNVMLPMLIGGKSTNSSRRDATNLLKEVGIKEHLINQYPSNLSGGEKQRVAIARALSNSPKIMLCDEPTGALDSSNSIMVMELLKSISKTTLVIVVSHNLQLVNRYADRIIEISDGKIIDDQIIDRTKNEGQIKRTKKKSGTGWIWKIALKNYKKRIKRNLLSSLAFTITLSMLYLVFGFVTNKDNAIKQECYKQLDFGSGTISQEVKTSSGGLLSLTKSYRPELNRLLTDTKISKKYEICPNFSAILPQNIQISYDNEVIDDLNLTPVYSFDNTHVDVDLLIKGRLPNRDSLEQIVVNETALSLIRKKIKKDPLGESLLFNHEVPVSFVDEDGEYITDTFVFYQTATIVGVVGEIHYLPSPKVFYSYSALIELMMENTLSNLSTYNNQTITWYDRVLDADNFSSLSGYSYYLFLKNFKDRETVFETNTFDSDLSFTSQSILLTNSLINFLDVAEYGTILFLIITFIGAILILSIMSFTNFSEDHKNSAILSSIGASNDEIQEIYLLESLINGVLSFGVSIVSSILLSKIINLVIKGLIGIDNLISIPFMSFMGIKFLFPFLILLGILVVVLISTLLPISFSKKKTIKGELQSL